MAPGDTARLYHRLSSYAGDPDDEWPTPIDHPLVRQDFAPNHRPTFPAHRKLERRDFRPCRFRGNDRLEARRQRLFALAAPVFRRYGYRGATIKALAHACGLRPASLYHYFGSKQELATYFLNRPQMDWDSVWVDPSSDPLVQLIDLSFAELPNYLLAMRLADEIAGTAPNRTAYVRMYREGEAVVARLLAASAPGMSRPVATRVARDARSAMVGSAVMGLDPEPDEAARFDMVDSEAPVAIVELDRATPRMVVARSGGANGECLRDSSA